MARSIRDNRGMIIVFTLILLAVFLTTALSFSFFIISDINKARAIDDSIIAYYSADAGMEESLYLMKKTDSIATIASLMLARPTGGLLAQSAGKWDIGASTDFEKTILRQRLYNGQSAKFFVLDRAGDNQTKSLTVEWRKGFETAPKLQVNLTQLTPQLQDGVLVYYTDRSSVEVADSAGGAVGCYGLESLDFDGSPLLSPSDYLAEFRVLGDNSDYVDQLSVKAYDKNCNSLTPDDKPNTSGITNLTLKSRGSYGKTTQTIVAHFLPQDPVSGLLGFVLFSEEDVAKE